MSSPFSPNGNSSQAPPRSSSSLETDIALLTRLLSQDLGPASDNADPDADPVDVEELLRRLEAAEGIADGVEERLDGIIGHLDNLLHDLETPQGQVERGDGGEGGGAAAAKQSGAGEDAGSNSRSGEDPESRGAAASAPK